MGSIFPPFYISVSTYLYKMYIYIMCVYIYIYNVFGAVLDFGCYEQTFSSLCVDILKHFRRTTDTSAQKVFLLCLYYFFEVEVELI